MAERQILRYLIIVAASITLALVYNFLSFAAEFSADLIQKTPGQTMTGKVFVKGKNMRMEMNTPGGAVVNIVLPDEGKALMLRPKEKMYMEMSANASAAVSSAPDEDWEKKATRKHLGTENMNGYLCDKYEIIYHDKSMGKTTQWISPKLSYPIKMVHQGQQGEVITEYKNIKENGISDSLFQVPAGYQKMQIPSTGQGMGMGEE